MAVKYKHSFCDQIIELGKEGRTPAQMAAELNISKSVFKRWLKDPTRTEFKEAYEEAQTFSQAYMEDVLLKGIKGMLPKFNAPAFISAMKSRFKDDYGDVDNYKIDIKSDIKNMTDEQIEAALKTMEDKKKKSDDGSAGAPAQLSV